MITISRLMMTSDAWTKKIQEAVLSGMPEDGEKIHPTVNKRG